MFGNPKKERRNKNYTTKTEQNISFARCSNQTFERVEKEALSNFLERKKKEEKIPRIRNEINHFLRQQRKEEEKNESLQYKGRVTAEDRMLITVSLRSSRRCFFSFCWVCFFFFPKSLFCSFIFISCHVLFLYRIKTNRFSLHFLHLRWPFFFVPFVLFRSSPLRSPLYFLFFFLFALLFPLHTWSPIVFFSPHVLFSPQCAFALENLILARSTV